MEKKQIRKLLTQTLNQLSELGLLRKQGEKSIQKLESHPLFQLSQRVLLFHSLPEEVNTHELIERYKDKKTIILPTVVGDNLELHIYNSSTPTSTGTYKIIESLGPLVPESDYSLIQLAVIPGVAFDDEGNRLGRGKGYYDRLLPLLKCHKIGLCYTCQFIDVVPHEPHDIKVDEVIF